MMVELTWWEEFGPFVLAVVIGATVSGFLVWLLGNIARTYERTMRQSAQRHRELVPKVKNDRHKDYTERLEYLAGRASTARSVQQVMYYGGAVFLAYHLGRLAVGVGDAEGVMRWVVLGAVIVPLVACAIYFERMRRFRREALLREETALDSEERTVS